MVQFALQSAALASFALGSLAADYIWNGRSTDFNDDLNWDGGYFPSSQDPNTQPGSVSLGTSGGSSVRSTVGSGNFFVGETIRFDGPTSLFLGGSGQGTTLNFDPENQNPRARFIADSEFGCPNNWLLDNAGDDSCPIPSSDDTFAIPAAGNYMLTIKTSESPPTFDDYRFSNSDCFNGAVNATTRTGSTVTIQFILNNGNSDQAGCRRKLNNPGPFTCSDEYTCSQADDAAAITTLPPITQQQQGGDSGGSTTIIIIAVVAVLVIIAIIVAVVVIVKKKNDSGPVRSTDGQASFENPMYDATDSPDAPQDDGMYAEPVSGDATSGYMDVPAGQAGGYMDVTPTSDNGPGYMDVAPESGGGSGYMDVAPGFEEDDMEDV